MPIPPDKLAELASRPSLVADKQGRLVFISPPFEEAFGYEASSALGQRPPYPWWPPESAKARMEALQGLLRSDAPSQFSNVSVTLTWLHADGRRIKASSRLESIDVADETLLALYLEPEVERSTYDLGVLSARQRETLDLLVQGLHPAAVASMLYISVHTVRNHTKAIFRKLGVHSQLQLMRDFGPGGTDESSGPTAPLEPNASSRGSGNEGQPV